MVKKKEEPIENMESNIPVDAEKAYEALAVEEKPRDVILPPEPASTGGGLKTFSERMADLGDLTDMQAIMMRLFPIQKDEGANTVMISRVHPDVFLPWIDIMATNEFMASDPRKPIDVAAIRMKWYGFASIGLDGKGRIDALELGGAARDTKLMEKKLGDSG